MGKHDDNFQDGAENMEKANEALDEGKVLKSIYLAGKGISKPVKGVIKDPLGFIKELLTD